LLLAWENPRRFMRTHAPRIDRLLQGNLLHPLPALERWGFWGLLSPTVRRAAKAVVDAGSDGNSVAIQFLFDNATLRDLDRATPAQLRKILGALLAGKRYSAQGGRPTGSRTTRTTHSRRRDEHYRAVLERLEREGLEGRALRTSAVTRVLSQLNAARAKRRQQPISRSALLKSLRRARLN
jgi:hypothetical protein